jgi:hypothetical protein
VILVTTRVIGSHTLDKTGVPQRTMADLPIFENSIYIAPQLPLKPNPVVQKFVQARNLQY